MVVYGLTLVLVMRFMPGGLASIPTQLAKLPRALGRATKQESALRDVTTEHQA
jgi:hypothetical protein